MSAATGQVVVIGAGVGGLTAAATLARQGLRVTVLEAHIYPGGCAGTFYHQGYQFDAGATLAAGFTPGGPMELVAAAAGVPQWPVRPLELAMMVHLPGTASIPRWAGPRRWAARREAFGESDLPFWRWQERAADAMWEIALSLVPWPPQGALEVRSAIERLGPWLLRRGRIDPGTLLSLSVDGVSSVARRLRGRSARMHRFVDAQLLIAAQAPARATNALYGAAALDLPRRGVAQAAGGMGALAGELSEAVTRHGGQVLYRQRASRVVLEDGRPVAVETERGVSYPAGLVVANLPPWSLASLLGEQAPPRLKRVPRSPKDAWGAFTVYMGVDASVLGDELALHHQIVGQGLGEGDTVYLSISPGWDAGRAPDGSRAVTLSTHTEPLPWWELYHSDRPAYEARKLDYRDKMIAAAERVIPGLKEAARLVLPGTPLTFARYTSRPLGWVGGYPQTHLLRTQGPRIAPGVWMVGDSVFPGQSVAAVALGGLRVAAGAMAELAPEWGGFPDQPPQARTRQLPSASGRPSERPMRAELQEDRS